MFLLFLAIVACSAHNVISIAIERQQQQFSPKNWARKDDRTVVLAYNKPSGVLTTHRSDDLFAKEVENPRRTVYEDIRNMKGIVGIINEDSDSFDRATGIGDFSSLHAVGRLDADTTGLLLLTNDGGLVHHVTNPHASTHNPENLITKTYEALIMGHFESVNEEPLSRLWDGVDIGKKYGGMTKPVDRLEVLDHPTHKSTLVSITISEGKNRQVRRMFHAIQSGVMKLKRTSIGDNLSLDGIEEEGQWRILDDMEVEGLGWKPRLLTKVTDKMSKGNAAIKKRKRRQR